MFEFTESQTVVGQGAPWREIIPKRLTVRRVGLVQVRLSPRAHVAMRICCDRARACGG